VSPARENTAPDSVSVALDSAQESSPGTTSTSPGLPPVHADYPVDSDNDAENNAADNHDDSDGDSPAVSVASNSDSDGDSSPVPTPELPRPRTRLQDGIRKPRTYTDGTIRYGLFSSTGEPDNLTEALGDDRWRQAMNEEHTECRTKPGTWYLLTPLRILLIASGFIELRGMPMVQLSGTRLVWLPKVLNRDMVLIMKIPSVLLLRQQQFALFFLLQCLGDGVFDS
jgi:hypothetical protein